MPIALVYDRYGGPEVLALVDVPVPDPGPGQLRIAVHSAGVNPVDWKMREGYLRERFPLALPAVVGREASGVVDAVGPDVEGFTIGEPVFGGTTLGTFAEYALLPVDNTTHKPPSVSHAVASVLPVAGATAYDALSQLGIGPLDNVLVLGAGGGVGVAVVQLARARGADVVGVAGAAKRSLVERLGALHVSSTGDVADELQRRAPAITAIVDLVGGTALRAVAPLLEDRRRLVTAADERTAAELGGSRVQRANTAEVLDAVATHVLAGDYDPHITATFALRDAASALATVEQGHSEGKVVIAVPRTPA
jgi:NADPH:quinone reductase-like Zn-dependent oxidoreductase